MPASTISASDWAVIMTAYQRGEKTPNELAEEYGVHVKTITRGLRERSATRVSDLTESIGTDEDDAARKEREERVKSAKAQQETFAKYNSAIVGMTMRRLSDGEKNGDLRLKGQEILVLKNAGAIVARARQENWEILRIEDVLEGEESLPDLNVGEYTPEELEGIRSANEDAYLESLDDEAEASDLETED